MEENKLLINNNESYRFTLIKIEKDILKKVRNDKINAYYSLSDKRKNTNENVIILLSETDEIEKNYLRYVDEYHAAGYDLFIVDVSKNKNADSDLLEHLWLQHRKQLPKNIFIHGNNDQRENALLLYKNNIAKNNEIKGIILSSYFPKNEFIFPSDLEINTNIYFSYENPDEDYNNNIIYNELLSKNKKVKKISFTNRYEYNSFSELNKKENNKTLNSLDYTNNKKKEINEVKIGMPIKDQAIFSQIAEEKGLIIGVRPIDTNSTSLISSGEYSSKSLAIKAKSSDWGPMAGFIPVDQSLAKASAQKNLLKYNKAVADAINMGVASVSELYISDERVNELIENKVINYLYDKNSPLNFEVIHNNKTHEFFLEPQIIDGKQYYLVQHYNRFGAEPVLVIADPISNKPMIADYDLFTVIYPYSHLGTNTRVNMPVSWEEWKQSVNYAELTDKQKILYSDQLLYEKNEGHQLGFISQQIKELKNELNTALGRSIGMEIVHHGADDANPFAVIHDNFPATFFVPQSLFDKPLNSKNQTLHDLFYINNNGTVVLQSPDEFSKFQQSMIDLGYIAPLNEKWNDGINDNSFTSKRKISATFVDTKNEIGRKLSIDKKDKYTLEYEISLNKFNEGSYVKNNTLSSGMELNNNARNEINLLSSEYNRKNDLLNKMDNKNRLLSTKERIEFYSKIGDIQWFKKTGYKLLESLIKTDGLFLNRTNETKLISFFYLLSKYSDIDTPIYKSFTVKNSDILKNNYEKGNLLAFDGIFHGFSNIEKVKKSSSDNVYVSIVGKHSAKPLTSLHSGSSERAIIAPGTHFRVIKNKIINNKNYVVLEIANEINHQEPVFDLYDGELKGIGIDKHRTTFNEKTERKINSSQLNNIFGSWRGESLGSVTIKNVIDKIIEGKISVEYAIHKYFKEISKVFSSDNSNLLSNKLYLAIYDPLMSTAFNQYVNGNITLEAWKNSYNVNYLNDTVTDNINRIKLLINNIYDIPKSVDYLSDASIDLLSHYFNEPNKNKLTIDLLKIALNEQEYNIAINDVDYLISLSNKDILSSVGINDVRALSQKRSHENKSTDNLFELSLGLNNNETVQSKIKIHNIEVDKRLLISLGAKINNKKIEHTDIFEKNHDYSNLTFDADKLNDYFLCASGTDDDKTAIFIIKSLLNNKEENIKKIISINAERIDYIASYERLVKILELEKVSFDEHYWDSIRKPSLKIPRHMKILSKVGYANIGYSMWQSVNNTFSLAEQLNNPNISLQQRKEIITDLSLMWSEMAFNGISEMIEIAIAKGLLRYRHNPLEYVSKISTRVGVALNVLSVGFDIYHAYDNFSRISGETDEKRKIDYIVNGSFAVVSGLVTVGISIAILAGSTIAGPIGIVAGALIALATSIYNAVRLIEEAKKQVNFTPMEELNNGFYAFLMGDITPDKKNEIIYLDTENQLEEMIDKKAITHFEEIKKQSPNSSYFYTNEKQIYQEHYYYKVIPTSIEETVDSIFIPLKDFISQRIAQNMSKKEAEEISALNPHLRAKKTAYKYYLPKEAIATNEKLIFDMDFYINELNRYTIKIASDDDDAIYSEIVDEAFLKNSKTTKEYVINKLGESKLENGLIKTNNIEKYYTSDWHENTVLYFNTHNGNDIIAAPAITQNTFDIYNGTKRLSGGEKDDVFNVFTSESPYYASRFYGREGNDTLRLIKTTGKYTGYKVDLQYNYVKFKNSEDKTNSQNFHSKLYLYQSAGHVYSKQLIDTMPNIELQDQQVIAYLDSIENVIGSETGDDHIFGNEEANYLNGAGSVDHLYGKGGNDTLVLNEGYAEGGEGNDNYIILRSSLDESYNKLFETIINETNKLESSVVRFNYCFYEVVSIKRNKKDIIFNFKINNETQEGKHIYHSVTLKNVYDDYVNNTLSHRYTLITQDGFALTLDESAKDKILYKFSYLEKYNESKTVIKDFYINEYDNLVVTAFKSQDRNIKLLPEFKYSGFSSGTNLRFGIHGNNQNNNYFGIESNSFIKLSQGNDSYQIKTFLTKNNNERVNISLSDYIDKLTDDDVSHFFLTDISGFDLTFKDGLLSHRYLPDDYLTLSFDPELLNKIVDTNVSIRLIDKDNIVFTLPTKDSHSNLLMPVVNLNLNISNNDDLLVIPESLILNKEALSAYGVNSVVPYSTPLSAALADKPKELIDLLPILELSDGNDIVVNHNNMSSVIDGGKGDDNILVNKGHHILIAGKGNDRLSGGEGNDLLISQFGHDYLSGGEGSNVYVVQKRQSHVTIYDEGKNSHILVTGLAENETLISSQVGNNTQYQTQDKQFTLIVKMAANEVNEKEQKPVISMTETSSELSLQGVANIIQDMAIFNQQQFTVVNNHETMSLSTWSPLALVEKQL